MPLMNSCTSTRTEYEYITPDVVFPIFPEPDGVTLDEEGGVVSMPLEYYIRIAEYKRDVDKVRRQIERMHELYNGGGQEERKK